MTEGITFQAILNKIQSTTDGGWRVTLDVSDDQAEEVLSLNKHRKDLLQIGVVPCPRRSRYAQETPSPDLEE